MTRVFLLGMPSSEANRLVSGLHIADRSLEVSQLRDEDLATTKPIAHGVIIVSGYGGGSSKLSRRVAAVAEAGFSAIVLLPAIDLFNLDVHLASVDLCFPPFSIEELAVRIRATALRSEDRSDNNRVIRRGPLEINMAMYEVKVADSKISLTYKEYQLLLLLAENPGHVYTREQLLRRVWEYDYFGGTRTVDVHVRRLRSKIDDVRHRFIETVRNVGYRFAASSKHSS